MLNLMMLFLGGFAHVYLVQTAEPVYGTTHHVLKRIAVANESMLNEVKKEVDIMVRFRIQYVAAPNFTGSYRGFSKDIRISFILWTLHGTKCRMGCMRYSS